ncbi:hypothetical protein CK203_107707 [Vitis vinifera]|uniref:Uncharacterized protein n=1 Tax=Vitis vinifera TaxID=29760 RepID=A0A438CR25_VITVI|nr:hypothetical protein CK203_107707 [Vitis vinifera]
MFAFTDVLQALSCQVSCASNALLGLHQYLQGFVHSALMTFALYPLTFPDERGKCWFAIESKTFEVSIEEVRGKLRGTIVERSRGFSSWIRFGWQV